MIWMMWRALNEFACSDTHYNGRLYKQDWISIEISRRIKKQVRTYIKVSNDDVMIAERVDEAYNYIV